jgi:hypothetical protein
MYPDRTHAQTDSASLSDTYCSPLRARRGAGARDRQVAELEMRPSGFHDPFAGFAILDEAASTRRLGGAPFGGGHSSTSALFHCCHSLLSPASRACY